MWPQPIYLSPALAASAQFVGYQEWATTKAADIVLTYPEGAEVGDLIIVMIYDQDTSVTVSRMFVPSTPGWSWINCPDYTGTNENTFFGRFTHIIAGQVQPGTGFSLVPGVYSTFATYGGMYVFKANSVCPIGRQYQQTGNATTTQVIYSNLSGTANDRHYTAPIWTSPTSKNSRALKLVLGVDSLRANSWGFQLPDECLGEQVVSLNRAIPPTTVDTSRIGIIMYDESPVVKTEAKRNWLPYSDGGTAYSNGASAGVWHFVNTYIHSTGTQYQPIMTLGQIGTPTPEEKYFYIDVDLPADTRFTWSIQAATNANAIAMRVRDFDTMDLGQKLVAGTGVAIPSNSFIIVDGGGGGAVNTDPYFMGQAHAEFIVGSYTSGQLSITFKTRKAGTHRLQLHACTSTTSDDYLRTGTTTGSLGYNIGPTTLYEGNAFTDFDHCETTPDATLPEPVEKNTRFTVGWLRSPLSTTGYASTGFRQKSYDIELIAKTDTPKPTVLTYIDRRHTVHISDDGKSITGGVKAGGSSEPTFFTSNLIPRPGFFGAPDKVYFEVNVGTLAVPTQGFVIGVGSVASRNAIWDNIADIFTMGGATRKGIWSYCTYTQTIVNDGTELVGAANAQAITPGNIVGVAIDRVNHTIEFFKNGVSVYPAMDISLAQYRFLMVKANPQQGNVTTSIQNLTFNFTGPFVHQPAGFTKHDWWLPPVGTPAAPIVYTAADTWTKPAGLKGALVVVYGGGGGGGGGSRTSSSLKSGGGGGGGGGRSFKFYSPDELPASVAVTVGAGGAGGLGGDASQGNGYDGSAGGGSSFGTLLVAGGGGGGAGGDQIDAAGGTGGTGQNPGGSGAMADNGPPLTGGGTGAAPCGGGAGGSQNLTSYYDGGPGGSNLQATGGAGGTALVIDDPTPPGGVFGNPGSAGGAGAVAELYHGGAGGGGGGALRINSNPSTGNFSVQAPPGAAGGFPGGGGGGGGAMCYLQNQIGGDGGDGSVGAVIVVEYY